MASPTLAVAPTPGLMAVDFEERVDFAGCIAIGWAAHGRRCEASELGALLVFDNNNIRYLTSTAIGEWARDKMCRFAVLHRQRRAVPVGLRLGRRAPPDLRAVAAARDCIAGMVGCAARFRRTRRSCGAASARSRRAGRRTASADMPLGVDVVEPPMLFELQRLGIEVRDGQQVMLDAREIKSRDEIMLLQHGGLDGRRRLPGHLRGAEARRAGDRDRRAGHQAALRDGLGRRRGDQRRGRRALQPASAQLHRPHHPAGRPGVLRHHPVVQWATGPATTARSASGARPSRSATPTSRPGVDGRRDRDGAAGRVAPTRWRGCVRAQDFGFSDEMEAFALQFGHGLGVALHERPIISRLISLEAPIEIKAGHGVRAGDLLPGDRRRLRRADRGGGRGHRRGCEIITLFPAEELFVANPY